jgi:fructokinase
VVCVLSPERVVLGGGVMSEPKLLPLPHGEVSAILNGYLDTPAISDGIASYITLPALEARAGVLGAIALGETA